MPWFTWHFHYCVCQLGFFLVIFSLYIYKCYMANCSIHYVSHLRLLVGQRFLHHLVPWFPSLLLGFFSPAHSWRSVSIPVLDLALFTLQVTSCVFSGIFFIWWFMSEDLVYVCLLWHLKWSPFWVLVLCLLWYVSLVHISTSCTPSRCWTYNVALALYGSTLCVVSVYTYLPFSWAYTTRGSCVSTLVFYVPSGTLLVSGFATGY